MTRRTSVTNQSHPSPGSRPSCHHVRPYHAPSLALPCGSLPDSPQIVVMVKAMAFLANVSVLSTLIFPKGKILRPTNWNGLSSLGLSSMQVLISGTRRRNAKFSNRTTLLSNCAGTWGEADFVRTHSKTRVLFPLAHACLWCMLLSSRDISITCCWTSLLISSWKAGDTAAIGRCEFGLNKDGWSKSSSGGDGGFMLFTSFMFGEDCTDEPVVIKPRLLLLNRHHLIQNGFKHRFARSQRRVLVLHFPTSYVLPINLSVSHDPSTIITLSTCQTDLKRRFLFVCKTSERWAMFKALGRRSYPRFLFFCLWGVSDLQSRNLSWFIFRHSYHDSIHNSQLSNKCLLFLFLFHFRTRDLLCHRQFLWHQKKLRSCDLGSFKLQELMGEWFAVAIHLTAFAFCTSAIVFVPSAPN